MRGKAAWSAEDARGDEVEEEEEAGEGEEGLEGQDRGEGEHGIGGGCWTVVVGGDAGGGGVSRRDQKQLAGLAE